MAATRQGHDELLSTSAFIYARNIKKYVCMTYESVRSIFGVKPMIPKDIDLLSFGIWDTPIFGAVLGEFRGEMTAVRFRARRVTKSRARTEQGHTSRTCDRSHP
jgi:hypothetical protein